METRLPLLHHWLGTCEVWDLFKTFIWVFLSAVLYTSYIKVLYLEYCQSNFPVCCYFLRENVCTSRGKMMYFFCNWTITTGEKLHFITYGQFRAASWTSMFLEFGRKSECPKKQQHEKCLKFKYKSSSQKFTEDPYSSTVVLHVAIFLGIPLGH